MGGDRTSRGRMNDNEILLRIQEQLNCITKSVHGTLMPQASGKAGSKGGEFILYTSSRKDEETSYGCCDEGSREGRMLSNIEQMECFFKERGFGRTIGFGERPAVIVIDLIGAFTNQDLPLGADLDGVIKETQRILDTARTADVPIFFSTVAYEEKDFRDAGIWAMKQTGVMTLRAGTPEVEVDARLGKRPEEPVIVKKYASLFFGTDFITRLQTLQTDTLILTGCTTSGCVRATAVDGLQYGFRVMVVKEAVGDRAPLPHEQSLFDLHAKYADVVSVDDTISYLEQKRKSQDMIGTEG